MSLTNYKILQTASPDELAAAVNAAITGGAQPYGSPIAFLESSNRLFFQAVADGIPDGGGGLPDDQVAVADGATLAVLNSAGADSHNATAAVSGGDLTSLKLAATVAFVDNADTVAVVNSASGDSHNATATVAAGALTNVKLAATVALVDQADAVAVHNSAGTNIAGAHTAEVAAGVLTDVKLAATVAVVSNAQALAVPVTGTYATTVTFTVANGVITGIVLS